ncbi:hypothetical protein DFH06DRAFT_1133003 [Mycena polygramma]|nr:hypothetical protein DFH06DRAFT_1133003 [Mycena polygramma]
MLCGDLTLIDFLIGWMFAVNKNHPLDLRMKHVVRGPYNSNSSQGQLQLENRERSEQAPETVSAGKDNRGTKKHKHGVPAPQTAAAVKTNCTGNKHECGLGPPQNAVNEHCRQQQWSRTTALGKAQAQ